MSLKEKNELRVASSSEAFAFFGVAVRLRAQRNAPVPDV